MSEQGLILEAQSAKAGKRRRAVVPLRWRPGTAVAFQVVDELPSPKGSMVARNLPGVSRPVLFDRKSKTHKKWATEVRVACGEAMRKQQLVKAEDTPFTVEIVFYLPRPTGQLSESPNGWLVDAAGERRRCPKPSAPPEPRTKPDLDKLERTILDCLSGVAYDDDARVVRVVKEKRYADTRSVGAMVRLVARAATIEEQKLLEGKAAR